MKIRPITPELLVVELAERAAGTLPGRRLRVAVDGAAAADPDRLGTVLADRLRVLGRATLHVRTDDYLRPASLRYEFGRTNPEMFYAGWLDEAGLRREVLGPAGPAGTGRVLPALRDARTDRASRADYVLLPPGGVVVVTGPLLLGGGLPFDLTVHLALSPAALARRTPVAQAWTLPVFQRYETEVAPSKFADIVVRLDDPRHPALVEAAGDRQERHRAV